MKLEFSGQIFEKYSNIKLNKNLSSGIRVTPYGQTDMVTLIVAFRNFAKAPKTSQLMLYREIMAVCSQIHTKHINTVCGQNVELLNFKLAVHIVTTGL